MKTAYLLTAASVALGLTGSALAQIKIYVAAAPALRSEVTTAIENLLLGQNGIGRAYNGAAIVSANVVSWTGGTIAGHPVTIKITCNGSGGAWKTNSARPCASCRTRTTDKARIEPMC